MQETEKTRTARPSKLIHIMTEVSSFIPTVRAYYTVEEVIRKWFYNINMHCHHFWSCFDDRLQRDSWEDVNQEDMPGVS